MLDNAERKQGGNQRQSNDIERRCRHFDDALDQDDEDGGCERGWRRVSYDRLLGGVDPEIQNKTL